MCISLAARLHRPSSLVPRPRRVRVMYMIILTTSSSGSHLSPFHYSGTRYFLLVLDALTQEVLDLLLLVSLPSPLAPGPGGLE